MKQAPELRCFEYERSPGIGAPLRPRLSIPDFGKNGLLPPAIPGSESAWEMSPYVADMVQVVDRFGTTEARRALLGGLLRYRQLLADGGFTDGIQFIGGSFVEDVEARDGRAPADIDVFSILNAPARYLLDSAVLNPTEPTLWELEGADFWRKEVADVARNRDRFGVHSEAVLLQDCNKLELLGEVMFRWGVLAHQRTTGAWKGTIVVPLDPGTDAEASERLRATTTHETPMGSVD